jgi:hypothetical protein
MLTAMLAAAEALAPALALELAPVRVNAVTAGLIDTSLMYTASGAELDTITKNPAAISPEKCVGTADEVAQVIFMLMTNDYLTEEVVHGDRGVRFMEHRSSDRIRSRVRRCCCHRKRRTPISRADQPRSPSTGRARSGGRRLTPDRCYSGFDFVLFPIGAVYLRLYLSS